MTTQPFFSIIIPTYNHAHFIKRCLDSLIAQTYTNWEAIVVNNFSIDNTVEVVEKYQDERICLVNNANNGIIAVSRNKGIEVAKGDWICFLDSDDWWREDKLEVCLPYLEENDFLYHDLAINENGHYTNKFLRGRVLDIDNIVTDIFTNENPIINSSTVIRKTIIDVIGPISEDKELIAVEDLDYWLRIMNNTSRVKYIPISLGYYWIGENISQNISQIDRERAIFNKYVGEIPMQYHKIAYKALSFRIARLYHTNGFFYNAIKYYFRSLYFSVRYIIKPIVGIMFCLCCYKR